VNKDNDTGLVERLRTGEAEAFVALIRTYQRPLYNAAYRVLGNADDATDVVQAVFLKVVERLDGYDAQYKLFSWLYRITVNEAVDVLRRRQREEPLEEDFDQAGPDHATPEAQLGASQRADLVQRALMSLKADDRIVITLRHFSELSYEEIAVVLDVSEKTVKSRIYEARQRLAGKLGELR
jgi:RNA polymerase sigma-70 factor (ECF subfamily)